MIDPMIDPIYAMPVRVGSRHGLSACDIRDMWAWTLRWFMPVPTPLLLQGLGVQSVVVRDLDTLIQRILYKGLQQSHRGTG